MNLTVLHDPWGCMRSAGSIRIEARGIATEFGRAGHAVRLVEFDEGRIPGSLPEALLLRVPPAMNRRSACRSTSGARRGG